MIQLIMRHQDGREVKINDDVLNAERIANLHFEGFDLVNTLGHTESELRENYTAKLDDLQRKINPDKKVYEVCEDCGE